MRPLGNDFVETKPGHWVHRGDIDCVSVMRDGGNPRVSVLFDSDPRNPDVLILKCRTEAEAEQEARRIAGHGPEWIDSAITDPRTTIGRDSDFGPFIEGVEQSSGEPFVFRIERMRGVAACFVPFSPYYYKSKGFPQPVKTPEFWRHIPIEEKMALSRKLFKLKCEEEEDE